MSNPWRPIVPSAPILLLGLVLLALSATAKDEAQSQLTGDVASGRRIFRTGRGSQGHPILASVTDPSIRLPADLLTCAGCHGIQGKGKSEGGIAPPNITWSRLLQPSDSDPATGRLRRDPYSTTTLIRAITQGIDSSGNPLNLTMPRYDLTPGEGLDLAAYLRQIESELDPGLTDDAVHIGILVPGGRTGSSIRRDCTDFARWINESGGIYRRRLRISYSQPSVAGATPEPNEEPFVWVACTSITTETLGRFEQAAIPVVAWRPPSGMGRVPGSAFFLYSEASPSETLLTRDPDSSPATHLSARRASLMCLKLVVHVLRRSGADVNRQTVIRELETLDRHPLGPGVLVSFSRDSHIGTRDRDK